MSTVTGGKARKRLLVAAAIVIVLLLAFFVPPLFSLAHYKTRIAELMSRALGRPVRISAVEARLLPRPGFEIDDLTVEEDPSFGAEPILHANTVDASLRLLSLWRGKLEISRISLDEASFNLVRTEQGRWNVDALFRSATGTVAQHGGSSTGRNPFPTIVATNSRVNFKRGIEKLPYSLTNADLSLSSIRDGGWEIGFKGQPVRTDLILNPADTGELEVNATIHDAPELRQMPLKLQAEWKKAQLGQLTKLLLGADAGWRGDLTGDLTIQGTAGDATVQSRLKATNVHRMELATLAPLDFDANCSFNYHASALRIEKIECDSPLGNGQLRLTGQVHQQTGDEQGTPETQLAVELKSLPAEAGLDILRTLRAGVLPGIEANGTVNGQLKYSPKPEAPATGKNIRAAKAHTSSPEPLTGSLTIDGLELTGGALKEPMKFGKIELHPVASAPNAPQALEAKVPFSVGAPAPLQADVHLERTAYRIHLYGPAATEKARNLVIALGLEDERKLPVIQGGTLNADLELNGPWIAGFATDADHFSGTATLRNATFSTPLLLSPVEIASAILRFDAKGFAWDDVNFTYGPLTGSATAEFPTCIEPCLKSSPAQFTLSFEHLDAAAAEAAFLGGDKKQTLIAKLLEKLKPNPQQPWPELEGSIQAASMSIEKVNFTAPHMKLRLKGTHATIESLDAQLLGGTAHLTGTYDYENGKPVYSLDFQLNALKPAEVGSLFGQSWGGASASASGKLTLGGYTGDELTSSATGTLHFDWKHGSISAPASQIPAVMAKNFAHFDAWSGEAQISGGSLRLGENQLESNSAMHSVNATITLSTPAKMIINAKQ